MRREEQRLQDILEALDSVARIIDGLSEAEFLTNEVIYFAVAQRLTIVGEAAAALSRDLRDRHPLIPWVDIVAFRNFLVHEYFGIHWPIVWLTASEKAPRLREQIGEVLRAEFPSQP